MKCPIMIKVGAIDKSKIEKYKDIIEYSPYEGGTTYSKIDKKYYPLGYYYNKIMGNDPDREGIIAGLAALTLVPKKRRDTYTGKDIRHILDLTKLHEIDEFESMKNDKDFYKRQRPYYNSVTGLTIGALAGLAGLIAGRKIPFIKRLSSRSLIPTMAAVPLISGAAGYGVGKVQNIIDRPIDDPNKSVYSHFDPRVLINESNRLVEDNNNNARDYLETIRGLDGSLKHLNSLGIQYGKKKYDPENEVLRQMIYNRTKPFWQGKNKKLEDKSIGKFIGEESLRAGKGE